MDKGEPVKANILLVEDNYDVRRSVSDILHMDGYSVTACDCPMDASEVLETQRFDAVLSDLFFDDGRPDKFLMQVLEQRIPLVVLSAAAWQDPPELDGAKILRKPARPKEITEAIEAAIAKQRKPRILYVDDDRGNSQSFELFADFAGYSVTSIRNPYDAYQLLQRESFDLVISDLSFNSALLMDPLPSSFRLEDMFQFVLDSGTPLLILSAAHWDEFPKLEGVEILQKPTGDLIEKVGELLERKTEQRIEPAELSRLCNPDWHITAPAIKHEIELLRQGRLTESALHMELRTLREMLRPNNSHHSSHDMDEMMTRYFDIRKRLKRLKEKPEKKQRRLS